MVSKRFVIIAVSLFALIFGCKSTIKQNEAPLATQSFTCDKLLDSLIRKSDYKNPIEGNNVSFSMDQANDSSILVHVTHLNEEHSNVTAGWLQIDLKRNRITDITINPDNPIIIGPCDPGLMKQVKKRCTPLF